jgi:cytochrome c peroxidase
LARRLSGDRLMRLSFVKLFVGFVVIVGGAGLLDGLSLAQNKPSLPRVDASFPTAPMASIELGRLLFYDSVLSGNKNVSCAACHNPKFATSDGVSLAIGDGGIGLGPDRIVDPKNMPESRIGRNAPALFNLGAAEFTALFDDGRIEMDQTRPSGIRTPLEDNMVSGFSSLLSVQAMFPVLSPDEMAGHYSENEISKAVRQGQLSGEGGAWSLIARRVAAIPAYKEAFASVLAEEREIRFTDISNVIAEFVAFEWRADNSPFDNYLRGLGELPPDALAGMDLFYGKAGCSACHSGQFQSDQQFYAIAMPQIGPGKATAFETGNQDIGRMRVTGNPEDSYKFRTPSLRNIAQTAPYGHSGAYATLEAVVRHHLNPVQALINYDRSQAVLPPFPGAEDWNVLEDPVEMAAIAKANQLQPIDLSDGEVASLIAFLNSLTDPESINGRLGIPQTVPSGLPVPGAP